MQHNAKRPPSFCPGFFYIFFNFNGPGGAEGSVRLQKVHIAKAPGMRQGCFIHSLRGAKTALRVELLLFAVTQKRQQLM